MAACQREFQEKGISQVARQGKREKLARRSCKDLPEASDVNHFNENYPDENDFGEWETVRGCAIITSEFQPQVRFGP